MTKLQKAFQRKKDITFKKWWWKTWYLDAEALNSFQSHTFKINLK